ncbi:MAG TPA: LysM peptidoglycan-binding domain-containing protein [Rhizomicrobium sp.]|nr:LysM peptidoglycan-binding domain-containing protein [Rhizomicrobium sp.]
MTADESESAREDLWLTYQNYDPAVKQAVRRLGALPGNNVEEFKALLLASRERKRAKEFEADVVRRLQGEVFVDDEVLQQTLIVLHAENPGLAEAFKKFVAENGRPGDIDLAVARLRSGTDDPVMPERMPRKPRETPIMSQLITPEEAPTPPPSAPMEEKPPRPALVVSRGGNAPAPQPANDIASKVSREPPARTSRTKYAAAAAVLLLAGAGGLYVLMPKSANKPPAAFEATDVPLRQAAVEDAQPAPKPSSAAEPAQTAPAPAVGAQQAARDEVNIPAPPMAAAPPAHDATAPSPPASANGPVPGTRYKVVKGDMLSVIAQQAYGDASLYPLIQRANPGLRNADRIYYDQMITLPPRP